MSEIVLDRIVREFREQPLVGYVENGQPASEPVAWASMVLAAVGESEAAKIGANWLASLQAQDGSVGVREREPEPRWPTGLATLAWLSVQELSKERGLIRNIDQSLRWIVHSAGKTQQRDPQAGHDTTLAAWPWAEGTHSWVEPTAMNVLALRAAGLAHSPRARVGIAMLTDRQLDSGGCNYGNTTVLGQELRPHVMPSALALLALSGEPLHSKTARTLDYLRQAVQGNCGTLSMCLGILALVAYERPPPMVDVWLAEAWDRVQGRDRSPWKKALIAQAALGKRSPAVTLMLAHANDRTTAIQSPAAAR